jgi:hypothetical protein
MSPKQAPKAKPKDKKLKARRETIRDLGVKPAPAAKVKGGLLGRAEGPTTKC